MPTDGHGPDRADPAQADEWTAICGYRPFALLFLDGGGKLDGPDAVDGLIAPGASW